MNNKQQDQDSQRSHQGSGSAENKGQSRRDQEQPLQDISGSEKRDIEKEIGTGRASVVGLHDLGAESGREDVSGGSGDEMENTSSGEPTDRK